MLWPPARSIPWLLGLSLWLTAPGHAYMPPDAALRRTQAIQYIDYGKIVDIQKWAQTLAPDLSPRTYLTLLNERYPDQQSFAWTFYACWSYLDFLDTIQDAYLGRVRALDKGREWLQEYEKRCHRALRGNSQPDQERSLLIPEADTQPKNLRDEQTLHVFRPLPWPDTGFTGAQIQTLLEASREDQQRAREQSGKIEGARRNFVLNQNVWTTWVVQLTKASQRFRPQDFTANFQAPGPVPDGKESPAHPLNPSPTQSEER